KRLSRDGTVSCATCHDPKRGWTDQAPVSTGIKGQRGTRSAPTVLDSAYSDVQFWDGRAASLEEQAKGPIENPVEMGFTHKEAEARFAAIRGYGPLFKAAFGDETVTIDRIAEAIAGFERTVVTGDAPYDRAQAGDEKAMSASAQRGMEVFFGKANCGVCHSGATFSDSDFHNLGVGMSAEKPDLGRYAVTKLDSDKGKFKTPTLRNLADTAPYMHDGSQKTLAEVVDFYDRGGEKNPQLDKNVRPLHLTAAEKADLLAFLESLNGDKVAVEEPADFPQ
ncbi:MAG: c-type cytochrome, partial [Elusimicrobia bacterium]|nr:c-type cytochrome [Elusimicrobiota bacterium]